MNKNGLWRQSFPRDMQNSIEMKLHVKRIRDEYIV
jgi:hypothetical protein